MGEAPLGVVIEGRPGRSAARAGGRGGGRAALHVALGVVAGGLPATAAGGGVAVVAIAIGQRPQAATGYH